MVAIGSAARSGRRLGTSTEEYRSGSHDIKPYVHVVASPAQAHVYEAVLIGGDPPVEGRWRDGPMLREPGGARRRAPIVVRDRGAGHGASRTGATQMAASAPDAPDLPGQALRGSGDFWAWGDSNLHLSGRPNRLRLTVEHRAAPPPAPLSLHLLATDHPRAGQPPLVRLELQDHPELSHDCQALPLRPEFRDPDDPPPPTAMSFAERIVAHLRSAGPTPHRALRATLRVRDQSLSAVARQSG